MARTNTASFFIFTCILLNHCGSPVPSSNDGNLDTSDPQEMILTGELFVSGVDVNGYDSSSRLALSWSLKDEGFDSLHIRVVNHLGEPTRSVELNPEESEVEINQLRSDTLYLITLEACIGQTCGYLGPIEKKTSVEVWELVGEGNSYDGIEPVIEDGNTKPWVMRMGAKAPAELEGRLQLYYDPLGQTEKGIKIGFIEEAPTPNPNTWIPFSEVSGFGLKRDAPNGPNMGEGTGPATFQAVPLSSVSENNIAIFFEGILNEEDGVALYRIDSTDGPTGRDFNPGDSTQCESNEIGPDGPCKTTLILSRNSLPDELLSSVRQSKLLVPLQDEGLWEEKSGSTMITTIHFTDERCSNSFFWGGYATYDGSKWSLDVDSEGCPKGWPGMQAPEVLHMGNGLYRAYFNHNEMTKSNRQPGHLGLKPFKLIYANAQKTGDPDLVEFEDWETIDKAREITVLWPDGSTLTEDEESRLDDHVVMSPTGHLDQLALYTNFSCLNAGPGEAPCPPIIAMAVLLNP